MEEGLGTFVAGSGIALSDPDIALKRDNAPVFRGRVIDLPNLEFSPHGGPGWISDHNLFNGDSAISPDGLVFFRDTYYKGNRDSIPRIATAHRIRLGSGLWVDGEPEIVFINVHIATLKEEFDGNFRLLETDELERTSRVPTPNARYLRGMQLSVFRDFVECAYRQLRLPVIIAGDFNSVSTAPEIEAFTSALGLGVCFRQGFCHRCGREQPAARAPITLFSNESARMVLSNDERKVQEMVGRKPQMISASEFCVGPNCLAPLFSHKTNFSLIDNILFTNGDRRTRPNLRFWLKPMTEHSATADLDTYFSDHLPLNCRFIAY